MLSTVVLKPMIFIVAADSVATNRIVVVVLIPDIEEVNTITALTAVVLSLVVNDLVALEFMPVEFLVLPVDSIVLAEVAVVSYLKAGVYLQEEDLDGVKACDGLERVVVEARVTVVEFMVLTPVEGLVGACERIQAETVFGIDGE